jgi:hypothetical protein
VEFVVEFVGKRRVVGCYLARSLLVDLRPCVFVAKTELFVVRDLLHLYMLIYFFAQCFSLYKALAVE